MTLCRSGATNVTLGSNRLGGCDVVPPPDSERMVTNLAARQHGAISVLALADAGFTHHEIAHRVACGWLQRVHRGVYVVGPLNAPLTRFMAAVLACGDGAAVSHGAAAVLHGIRPESHGPIVVTVPRQARHRPGIRVHRANLTPGEVTIRHGIPTTTPVRTLLDLATVLPAAELERAVNEAQVLRLPGCTPFIAPFATTHRGARSLQAATHTDPQLTRSEAEKRVLALIRAARLAKPQTNVMLHGFEVDLLWPSHRLVVEVDGYTVHSTRAAFERDRRRDATHLAHGHRVLRLTWRRIVEEPEATVATIASALASSG